MISWIKEMNVWMFVRRDLLDWSSQGCRTIIQHYLKQRSFIRFANIWKEYVYHTEISGQLDLNHPKSCKEKWGQKESDRTEVWYVSNLWFESRWDMLYRPRYIANVFADDLSEFYPPLRSPLLMMSNTAESEKFRKKFHQQIFVNVPNHTLLGRSISNVKKQRKTASTI